ncbi:MULTISPECIES: 50S ribosomal protein L18 [Geomonas]|uniref:Large ribosomal subunit protein uL18 n=4 Tax=Geomonas TaxID=2651583 RepID=A0A6V8N2X5_9BACT|nr:MULTISPECIES: 50S ribosomal protein L18 [Geomonas]MBJ6752014.1 50S ribosomal protein L18 [Geomonas anaerohicana]QWV92583.1 50S ribosomal protein L18 [Geomonas oryzisoli]QXE90784.1 50S ribosomal protein L18 [Geomonas subterranea]QXM11134.1 50S ribosomal protein L18 [Geomonas subterranea]UPU36972.1 50S ribosomal protein L18 [Geomonas paludis]
MSSLAQKQVARLKRQTRVRKKITGSPARPRLNVFKSARHIYAQLIDDTTGATLASASTLVGEVAEGLSYTGNIEAAAKVGAAIAKKALEKDIKAVVFDRNGFLYHGRIKALAEAARENGLSF